MYVVEILITNLHGLYCYCTMYMYIYFSFIQES